MKILLLCLACILVASCAAVPPSFEAPAEVAANQHVEYQQGKPLLVSTGSTSMVVAIPEFIDGRVTFVVTIANLSDRNIEYQSGNVQPIADGEPVALVSAAQLRAEADSRARGQEIAAALNAFSGQLNAAQAGRSTSYGTANASAYGSGGYATGAVAYHETTYDAAKVQAAQAAVTARSYREAGSIEADHAAAIASVDHNVLQRTTIHPGQHMSGTITIDAPDMAAAKRKVGFNLTIGGDLHQIRFVESQP